ncbi:mitotic spindle checkpoint protein Bub3 [Sporothrix curviconia]|uniref:Mitotic spindle checkpoint protein Bub3 n=1 Tax=Sporothrix curviconia TaxID=1260050 RepID=A0ABP0CLU5_9PEZI
MPTADTLLPALKATNTDTTIRRLMSLNSDDAREQDDRLYLQRGQGAQYVAGGQRSSRPYYGVAETASVNGGRDDVAFVPESDDDALPTSGTAARQAAHMRPHRRPSSSRTFSPLLSPPTETLSFDYHEHPYNSQPDVYDVAPPPGYKRLKKVHGTRRQIWEDTRTVEAAHSAGAPSLPLMDLAYRPANHPTTIWEVRSNKTQLPFPGDGFSSDETKTRRTKRRTKSNNSSNSAGSGSAPKKRKRAAEMSPVLGSLEVVTFSQDERARKRAETKAATLASQQAASRIDSISRFIALRPQAKVRPITI